jgi:hypothetical protein
MTLYLDEKIKVLALFDPASGRTVPYRLKWQGKIYQLSKINYYHRKKIGSMIQHIYHATDGNLDFRLSLDSETLSWRLEEIYDKSWN